MTGVPIRTGDTETEDGDEWNNKGHVQIEAEIESMLPQAKDAWGY